MADSMPPSTFKNGFREPTETGPWEKPASSNNGERAHYQFPPSKDMVTSDVQNQFGPHTLRSWPTIYNGTETPEKIPDWFKPREEVDVLICGAGPFGLQMAMSLSRQGVSCRIVDRDAQPLLAGRANGIHPRSLEILHSWGVDSDIVRDGPILTSRFTYKNGEQLAFASAFGSDSPYVGTYIITQPLVEKAYVRDLRRKGILVERRTTVEDFKVSEEPAVTHPIQATLSHLETGEKEYVRAKYMLGADGASSQTRQKLGIPFDGVVLDHYWGIIDAHYKSDFPYMSAFGMMTGPHGGAVVIPRENGIVRIYAQLSPELADKFKAHRDARRTYGGRVDSHNLTAEEVLEHMKKIFAPFTLEFASDIAWFAVWRISERVARNMSTPDNRIHIGGDAAHVHSVMGAFGLNSSMYDASNLGWKLGLASRGLAKPEAILPTYDIERRIIANKVIRTSGALLRFLCPGNWEKPKLRGEGEEFEVEEEVYPHSDGSKEGDLKFLGSVFQRNGQFLAGLDMPYAASVVAPAKSTDAVENGPIVVRNGVRAPNPRVSLDANSTGYLYDKLLGAAKFHVVVFASDLQGPVRSAISNFCSVAFRKDGFITKYGGSDLFNVVLVLKVLPFQVKELLGEDSLKPLREHATVIYDDRSPDEDAHSAYAINHARGGVAIIRPDLWVGESAWPDDLVAIDAYFSKFLIAKEG